MKAKKWLVVVLSALMVLAVGLGIAACGKKAHSHAYDAYDYDNAQHWKYCDEHGTDKSNIDPAGKTNHTWKYVDKQDGQHHDKVSNCGDIHPAVTVTENHVYDQKDNTECVCGAKKPSTEPEHVFAQTWAHDDTEHWHPCTTHPDAGKEDSEGRASHVYDQKDNTECVCGAKKPSTQPEHVFAQTWAHDDTEHWHPCTTHPNAGKEDSEGRAPHVYNQKDNTECVCGAKNPNPPQPECQHTNKVTKHDGTQHWEYCNDCQKEIPDTRANHTLTENQSDHTFACTCGYTMSAWEQGVSEHTRHSTCTDEGHNVVNESELHQWSGNTCTECGYVKATAQKHAYLIGNVSDAGYSFEHLVPFTPVNGGTFQLTITLFKGETFKVILSDTENPTAWTGLTEFDFYDLDGNEPTEWFSYETSEKYDIMVVKDGTYTFTLDPSKDNGNGPNIIDYTYAEVQWNLYYYGTSTEWAKNGVKLTSSDNGVTYTTKVNVEDGEQFKVVNLTNGLTKYFGDPNADTTTNPDQNYIISKAGEYTITFTTATKSVTFAKVEEEHTDTYTTYTDNEDGKTHTAHASCGNPEHDITNEAHVWGDNNKCTKCGADKPVEDCKHTNKVWQHDGTQHWEYCNDCKQIVGDKAPHQLDKQIDKSFKCEACGHTMSAWEKKDDNDHIRHSTCTAGENVKHEATYSETEPHNWDNKVCTDCGADQPAPAPDADTRAFYVLGDFEGREFKWEKACQMTLDTTDGHLFTLKVFMYAGEAFKIVYFDEPQTTEPGNLWDAPIGFADYDGEEGLFTEGAMSNIVAAKTGNYIIKIYTNDNIHSAEDGNTFSIIIEKDETATFEWNLYIYGDMNKWGAGEDKLAMTKGADGKYTATVTVTAEDLAEPKDQKGNKYVAFKVVNIHDGNVKYFGGEVTEDNKDGNFWLTKADTYTITFDTNKMEVGIKGENEDKPIPQPGDGEVVLVYVEKSADWATESLHHKLTFSEKPEDYEGHHYQLKQLLPAGAEFYLYETVSKENETIYYHFGAFGLGSDLFDASEAGIGGSNFVVKTAATYIFDFYCGTVYEGQPQGPHFDAAKEGTTPTPTPGTLKAGWYLVGEIKELPTLNWSNHVAEGYLEGGTITVKLTAGDKFKFSYTEGQSAIGWTTDTDKIAYTAGFEKWFTTDNDKNFVVREDCTGDYTFTISGTKNLDVKSDVVGQKPNLQNGWYVVGSIASLPTVNWNTFVPEGYVGTDLSITLTLTAKDQFKFAKYNGATSDVVDWGVGEIGYKSSNSTLFNPAGDYQTNFQAKAAGTYVFTLNESAKTATVTKEGQTVDPTPTPGEKESITVHYHNTNGWAKVHAYSWDKATETKFLGVWPGVNGAMKNDGENWWSLTYQVPKGQSAKDLWIIFTNGVETGTLKTSDIEITGHFTDGVLWVAKDNSLHATKEEALAAEGTAVKVTYTFYFYNAKDWTSVKIWAWGVFNTTGTWNTAPTMSRATDLGSKWYKYSFQEYESTAKGKTVSIIIFNGTNDSQRVTIGNKTGDNPVPDSGDPITITGRDYYISGQKNGYWSTTPSGIGVTIALPAMLPIYDVKSYLGA